MIRAKAAVSGLSDAVMVAPVAVPNLGVGFVCAQRRHFSVSCGCMRQVFFVPLCLSIDSGSAVACWGSVVVLLKVAYREFA